MDQMVEFAGGPFFKFSFAVLILGLIRLIILIALGIIGAVKKTNDKNIPYKKLFKETLMWFFPIKVITGSRAVFSIFSFLFHIGLIAVPLFFLDHILLWRQGLNISWPHIPGIVANILSIVTIISGLYLLGNRTFHRDTRFISKAVDYFLLVLILCIFITGLIASKPVNPMPYKTTMFIHIMCGNILFILIPFTKLAHCFLFPIVRIASNIAWRFPASAGEEINKTLYNEEIRKI